MRAIKKESLKYTIVSYCGYLIGIFSTIFLYTSDLEFYGTLRYVLAVSLLLSSFFTLGLNGSVVKLYSVLKNSNYTNGFVSFSIIVIFIFTLFSYIFSKYLPGLSDFENFWNLKSFIFPLICLYSLNSFFYSFLANFYITAIPNIFDSVLPKLNTIFCFLFFIYTQEVKTSLFLFLLITFLSTVVLYIYMRRKTFFRIDFNFNFLNDSNLKKEIISFSLFSVSNSFLYATISQIGIIIIGESGNLKANGLYAILISIIGLINIPLLAISKSSIPLISDYIDNRKTYELGNFYKKSSLFLFFIGSFLFLFIVTNFDAFFTILHKKELVGNFYIIIIIGFSLLIDLLTGINGNIINRSHYYKYNTIFISITALISFIVSYFLVIKLNYGIIGAAISTFISMLVYNILKLIFNYMHFAISPFSKAMIPIVIIIAIIILVNQYLVFEQINNPILFIIFNSITILLSYVTINCYFKIIDLKNIFNSLK